MRKSNDSNADLPNMIDVLCDSGKYNVLNAEQLTLLLDKSTKSRDCPLRLSLRGWTLDRACVQILSQALRENFPIAALSLVNCRFREDAHDRLSPASAARLALALRSNSHLKSLILMVSRVPSSFFQFLPEGMARNSTLTQLCIDSLVDSEDMAHLLAALNQSAEQLQVISIPLLFDVWTSDLQNMLSNLLVNGSHQFRKVQLRLRPILGTSIHNNYPECARRLQLWSLWKEFLVGASHLEEFELNNLTNNELKELARLVSRRKSSSLKSLHVNGRDVRLDTLTQLVTEFSSSHVKTCFKFTLLSGEEYNAQAALSKLTQAMTNNYSTEELSIRCTEYSATPREDLFILYPTSGRVVQSLLALNQAGRRYMLHYGALHNDLEKGIQVLAHVHQDVDALYHHLRENPSLCKQQAPVIAMRQQDNRRQQGTKRKCPGCNNITISLTTSKARNHHINSLPCSCCSYANFLL
jgi:hypothetical protein